MDYGVETYPSTFFIRLCVGIEDPGDLIDHLETALVKAGAVVDSEL